MRVKLKKNVLMQSHYHSPGYSAAVNVISLVINAHSALIFTRNCCK